MSNPPIQSAVLKSLRRWGAILFRCGLVVICALCSLWAVGAIAYDLPWAHLRTTCAIILGLGLIALAVVMRGFWMKCGMILAVFAGILVWWQTLKPRNDRDWKPEVDRLAHVEWHGDDAVTIQNIRNFDYRTETDFSPVWETRKVQISRITGMDLAINYWGSPWMAHPIVSFQVEDGPPICFSIETRMEKGESYSAIGGLYRRFELIYIVADERDVIRVRTNFRKGEDVYLYRTTASAAHAQQRFREYLGAIVAMETQPRWYNAVTTNCTTSIRNQRVPGQRAPWDWRMLLNGKADEMLYENQAFRTGGLTFAELKQRAHINKVAQMPGSIEDFSQRIRHELRIEN